MFDPLFANHQFFYMTDDMAKSQLDSGVEDSTLRDARYVVAGLAQFKAMRLQKAYKQRTFKSNICTLLELSSAGGDFWGGEGILGGMVYSHLWHI